MILIKPSFEIVTPINGEEILKHIELAARTCYKSEGKIKYGILFPALTEEDEHCKPQIEDGYAESARVLIPKLIKRGHFAMLEFGGMIHVKFICDRGVSHELVRHRLASFAQESTRFCNYGDDKDITYIVPYWFKHQTVEDFLRLESQYVFADTNDKQESIEIHWYEAMQTSEECYQVMILNGASPQEARSVLPNSLKTEINMSCNLREWREVFKQRTAEAAHPQMRELMRPLLDEFKKRIPIIFDDINY